MTKLKSFKVFDKTGKQVMTIIVHKDWSTRELNRLFCNGMNAVVVDERSQMVNSKYVD